MQLRGLRKVRNKQLGIVIVTFFPSADLVEIVSTLSKKYKKIVIVDNTDEYRCTLEAIGNEFSSVYIISLGENLGIARALNIGCSYLVKQNCTHALLLDQDSTIEADVVQRLSVTFDADDTDKLAIVSPKIIPVGEDINFRSRVLPSNAKWSCKRVVLGDQIQDVLFNITSGTLLSLQIWAEVGKFEEKLFMEYVDTEFGLRLRKLGYVTRILCSSALFQRYGHMEKERLFGKTFFPTNHKPLRYYYLSRNRLFLWWKYWHSFPGFIIWDLLSGCKQILLVVFFEKQRLAKVSYSIAGYRDFFLGKWGRYDK